MNLDRLADDSLWIAADTETDGFEAAYDSSRTMHCMQVYVSGEPYILRDRADIQHVLTEYVPCFVNAKFDVGVLRAQGYTVTDYHDIAVAHYQLAGASCSSNHSLNAMAERYLGQTKLEKPRDWAVFDEQAAEYALQDVTLTHGLLSKVLKPLQQNALLWNMYVNVDLTYVELLVEMHTRGVYVDADVLRPLVPVYEDRIADVVKQHTALYGYKKGEVDTPNMKGVVMLGGAPLFRQNVNNRWEQRRLRCTIEPVSLRGGDRQEVLNKYYPQLAAVMPRTANGLIKTDKHTLAKIEDICPAASLWLEYETRTKQLGTFLEPLIELADTGNSVVRASLHNYNTRTGRLSCSAPNVQQVPAHGERGAEVRRAFTAPPGYRVVVGDLDRIEVVVLAFYLQQLLHHNVLADRLLTGDVHAQNCEAWGCTRDAAKRGLFCIVYGGGPARLGIVLKQSTESASVTLSAINNDLRLEDYRNFFVEQAMRHDGFITNYFGRRLYVPELLSNDKAERASGRRKAGNYPIQSTAGDVFKLMQNAAYAERQRHGFVGDRAWQALVVHDEVIYIVRDDIVDDFINVLTPCYNSSTMFNGVSVSLKFGVGNNWYEAKGD